MTARPARILVALVALLVADVVAPAAASAHGRSVSYANWTLAGEGASVRLKLRLLDHNGIQAALGRADPEAVSTYLQEKVTLSRGDDGCRPIAPRVGHLPAPKGWLRFTWTVRCLGDGPLAVGAELLFDVLPSHLHLSRLTEADGPTHEWLLSEGQRTGTVGAAETSTSPGAAAWFEIGVRHILGGLDHLVFLLTLLLLASRVSQVALAVTGFTVGHSASLALAATGTVAPAAAIIEAVIGLTIAWVAAENVWLVGDRRDGRIPVGVVATTAAAALAASFVGSIPAQVLVGATLSVACYFALLSRSERPERARWLVAVVFGLVHGFAFASVLEQHALTGDALVWPLLSFNLGVEAGQLGVLLVAWPLWVGLQRFVARALLVHVGSAAAVGLGVFWFVSRAWAIRGL